jgi:hypothetical protein
MIPKVTSCQRRHLPDLPDKPLTAEGAEKAAETAEGHLFFSAFSASFLHGLRGSLF